MMFLFESEKLNVECLKKRLIDFTELKSIQNAMHSRHVVNCEMNDRLKNSQVVLHQYSDTWRTKLKYAKKSNKLKCHFAYKKSKHTNTNIMIRLS